MNLWLFRWSSKNPSLHVSFLFTNTPTPFGVREVRSHMACWCWFFRWGHLPLPKVTRSLLGKVPGKLVFPGGMVWRSNRNMDLAALAWGTGIFGTGLHVWQ